jgi:hypothetical protein
MRVLVVGDCRKEPRILLDTEQAAGVMLLQDGGRPSTIFQLLPAGNGWVRYTSVEDKNFAEVAQQLGFNPN